ncbi:MAG: AGE family epimerase/isomerase [Chloroflexota bacterium]
MDLLHRYAFEVKEELVSNILPFYARHMLDKERGGFYGSIHNDLTLELEAPKGLVQHGRLLWSYAQAARCLQEEAYLAWAQQAGAFLMDHLRDREHGGFFWFVDAAGRPFDTNKITYGQAFALYGLSEYALAAGDERSVETAVSLYHLLEKHTWDPEHGGYLEAFHADWSRNEDINVDKIAGSVAKTMNTHLHMLEAYTNLLRAWDDDQIRHSLRLLIGMMLDHIIDPHTGHLKLHFSTDWQPLTPDISYGHDIEASWLLVEAAEVLGDADLLAKVIPMALHMAQVTYEEGLAADGSLRYENHNPDKIWWAQAEAMVGFMNAYQLSGEPHFLEASVNCWTYVKNEMIDRQNGEWFWGRTASGDLVSDEKAGSWKAPYHNGRSCLEIMRRVTELLKIEDQRVSSARAPIFDL